MFFVVVSTLLEVERESYMRKIFFIFFIYFSARSKIVQLVVQKKLKTWSVSIIGNENV